MKYIFSVILLVLLGCNTDISKDLEIEEKSVEEKSIEEKPIEEKPIEEKPIEKEVVVDDSGTYQIEINYKNTYYVSTNGSNSNAGSNDNPWKTIEYAINSVGPGDRILIQEGEYVENIYPTVSGTKDNYITVEGEGNVIIRSSDSNCFGLLNNSFLYFKNLKLTGAKYANFEAYDETLNGNVNNIILDNIDSYDSFVGVSFTGVKNSLIINSEVHDNQFNIELIEYNENITISNNNIHTTSIKNKKLESYWSHSLQIYSTGEKGKINTGLKILNNNVYGGHMQGILAYRTENTLIEGNNCFSNGATGIQVESDDMQNSKNIIVQSNKCYNNSLRHESEAGIWIDDTVNAVVRNNEMYGNELGLIISGSKYVSAYNNNIHDNSHSTHINGGGLSVTSSKGQAGQVGVPCNNINIFNNRFNNNGGNSQRAHIMIGYFEYDTELRVSDIVFKNNTVANTPNSNIYKLDLQAFGDNLYLDYNHYYNDSRDSYFLWQMDRDPWGDYTEEPKIVKSIPDHDQNSSYEKDKTITKTHLAEIVEIIDSKTIKVDNSIYFCDGYDLISGDEILINSEKYQISDVDYSNHIVKVEQVLNVNKGDKVLF